MTRPVVRLLAAVLILLGAAAPAAAEWRRVDSPNFVVVGDVGERTLKDMAVRFEGFRETLSRILTERVTATPVPTLVVVFPSDRAFTPFKLRYNGKPVALSGLFMGRQDVNTIALVADGNPEGLRTVFHEYAHLVVANVSQTVPVWLNEGLAEYYSTFDLAGDRQSAVIGRVISSHLLLLNERPLLPLPELITVDHQSRHYNEGNQRTVFYAESWALTHMLLIGEPDRRRQFASYLTLAARGMASPEAWQSAFGDDRVESGLKDYVRRRTFTAHRYTFPEKVAAFTASAAKVSAADADGFLAHVLLQQGREDDAADLLAKRKDTGTSPWLETVSALVALRRGQQDDARRRLAAIDTHADWLTAYFAGIGLADSAGRGASPDDVAAVRRQFDIVRQAHGEMPHAIVRLARLELQGESVPSAETTAAVERARALAPGRFDYTFVKAQLLARQQAFAEARSTMGPLMSAAYPAHVRDTARSLMEYIVRLEAYQAQVAQAAAARGGAAGVAEVDGRPPAEPMELPDPLPRELSPEERAARAAMTQAAADEAIPGDTLRLGELEALLRKVQPGETRIQGTLTAIGCDSAGAAVFHVTTPGGNVEIATPRMGDVDFITYRTDLTGSVACGPLRSPIPIYLTWKPNPTAAGATVVVAVEFMEK